MNLAIYIEETELNELFLWEQGEGIDQVREEKLKEEIENVLSFTMLAKRMGNKFQSKRKN
jgi:hypothetical protein